MQTSIRTVGQIFPRIDQQNSVGKQKTIMVGFIVPPWGVRREERAGPAAPHNA